MVEIAKRQLCRAKRKDGGPCHAPAIKDGFCFGHCPELAEKASQARLLGGRHKAKSERLRHLVPPRLIPLFDKLETALDCVFRTNLGHYSGVKVGQGSGANWASLTEQSGPPLKPLTK